MRQQTTLTNEKQFVLLSQHLRECLGLRKANVDKCIEILDEYKSLYIGPLMLLRNPDCVDIIRRLRRYVGNLREWNYNPEQEEKFKQKADIIRRSAVKLYDLFKTKLPLPETKHYWVEYLYQCDQYKRNTKHLDEAHRFCISEENYSRILLDKLELRKSRKEAGLPDTEEEEVNRHMELLAIQNSDNLDMNDDDDDGGDYLDDDNEAENAVSTVDIWRQRTKRPTQNLENEKAKEWPQGHLRTKEELFDEYRNELGDDGDIEDEGDDDIEEDDECEDVDDIELESDSDDSETAVLPDPDINEIAKDAADDRSKIIENVIKQKTNEGTCDKGSVVEVNKSPVEDSVVIAEETTHVNNEKQTNAEILEDTLEEMVIALEKDDEQQEHPDENPTKIAEQTEKTIKTVVEQEKQDEANKEITNIDAVVE